MSASPPVVSNGNQSVGFIGSKDHNDYVTMWLGEQIFGIPVLMVRDVLRGQRIAKIPLAPPEIAGSMNLRGRIVTVIDLRERLGLPPIEYGSKTMSVVVEHRDELFSLLVDSVGDVMSLPVAQFEKSPANLTHRWREVSTGIYKLKKDLLVIIDVSSLLRMPV